MPEVISITPPDRDGNQINWVDYYRIYGRRVLAPLEDPHPDIIEKLITASEAKGPADVSFLGETLAHTMKSLVLSDGSTAFRVEYRVGEGSYDYNLQRSLKWVTSNQMLANALRLPDLPALKSGLGEYSGRSITTPEYLGLMATSTLKDGFLCVIAMSDESNGRVHPQKDVHRTFIRPLLDRSCLTALGFAYPRLGLGPSSVRLDGHRGNVLLGDKDVVRIDIDTIDSI